MYIKHFFYFQNLISLTVFFVLVYNRFLTIDICMYVYIASETKFYNKWGKNYEIKLNVIHLFCYQNLYVPFTRRTLLRTKNNSNNNNKKFRL